MVMVMVNNGKRGFVLAGAKYIMVKERLCFGWS
jgi:hypothetical protein